MTAEYDVQLASNDTIQEDRDTTAQLVAEAQAVVERLETALERASDGTYGTCQQCGAAISSERLAALPDASNCITCA